MAYFDAEPKHEDKKKLGKALSDFQHAYGRDVLLTTIRGFGIHGGGDNFAGAINGGNVAGHGNSNVINNGLSDDDLLTLLELQREVSTMTARECRKGREQVEKLRAKLGLSKDFCMIMGFPRREAELAQKKKVVKKTK